MVSLVKIHRPKSLTNPTPEEYDQAMLRLWKITNGDDQAMRDLRTVYWQGWNTGYEAARKRGE